MTTPVRSAPWAHFAWNNGAPTLVAGDGMAAPSSPATGRIQLNFAAGVSLSGATWAIGSAGGAGARVVPVNTTGLLEIQDSAGAAVNFNVTTGFAFVQARVTENYP